MSTKLNFFRVDCKIISFIEITSIEMKRCFVVDWVLVVFGEDWTDRMEYKFFGSIVEAFKQGNELVKSKGNSFEHYKVESLKN